MHITPSWLIIHPPPSTLTITIKRRDVTAGNCKDAEKVPLTVPTLTAVICGRKQQVSPMTNNGVRNNGLNNEHNNAHNASPNGAEWRDTWRLARRAAPRRSQTDGILICPVLIKPTQFSVHFILLIRYRGRLIGFDLPPCRVARSCAQNSPLVPPPHTHNNNEVSCFTCATLYWILFWIKSTTDNMLRVSLLKNKK